MNIWNTYDCWWLNLGAEAGWLLSWSWIGEHRGVAGWSLGSGFFDGLRSSRLLDAARLCRHCVTCWASWCFRACSSQHSCLRGCCACSGPKNIREHCDLQLSMLQNDLYQDAENCSCWSQLCQIWISADATSEEDCWPPMLTFEILPSSHGFGLKYCLGCYTASD